jgi:hypothetical protein
MKNFIYLLLVLGIIIGCNTSKDLTNTSNTIEKETKVNDTIRIANDELEYEIIIIEPGFQSWLASTARPKWYHSQTYLENRNIIYVNEWNSRFRQPMRYSRDLYELPIDYSSNIDYGYDVNYQLYNYFIFFQLKYKQQLGPRIPRI